MIRDAIKEIIDNRLADVNSGTITIETFSEVVSDELEWFFYNGELE
jgi:uncharacterized protein (DUF2164 family)